MQLGGDHKSHTRPGDYLLWKHLQLRKPSTTTLRFAWRHMGGPPIVCGQVQKRNTAAVAEKVLPQRSASQRTTGAAFA